MKGMLILGVVSLTVIASGQEFRLGAPVADFKLTSVTGQEVRLQQLRGDLTMVMFIATQCPVSNAYNERMKGLYTDYASRGVRFVAINSNSSEPAPEVASHASKNAFPFAVYKDPDNTVADRFGAQVTPEIFLLDANGVIRYHGSIDDSQNPANIKSQSLRAALDAMLAGQSVAKAETKAFGCTIKKVRKTS